MSAKEEQSTKNDASNLAGVIDVDDDDDFSDDDHEYMLGFAEEVEPMEVLRHRFPSKIGGRPAWLDPVALPTRDQLTCRASGKPLNFLLQVYAPLDDEKAHDAAFHRAVFMFATPQGSAVAKPGAVRAFRCQLPRKNPYYSDVAPTKEDVFPRDLPAADTTRSLSSDPWRVLEAESQLKASTASKRSSKGSSSSSGAAGTAAGAAGTTAADASSSDAAAPATSSDKPNSSSGSSSSSSSSSSFILYPELELIVEPEERESKEEEEALEKLMSDYQVKVSVEGELSEEELPEEVVDSVEGQQTVEQKHFARFQAHVACAPDQLVRYCFQAGAGPLWPSPHHLPTPADIPPCPHCGKPRQFEFQVMPQLLNHLKQDELSDTALDWSTIVVYSCSASCALPAGAPSAYAEEFVWVQPAL